MAADNRKPNSVVTIGNWQACYNSGDDVVALSCTVNTSDEKATISGAGLILNNAGGKTVSSFYAEFDGSKSVNLALNIPAQAGINVGASIIGVATGEADGQHYFGEENLTITNC